MKAKTTHKTTIYNSVRGHWMKLFISIAMIAIMFCNSSNGMNIIALAATDPVGYYQNVENEYLNQQVDYLTKAYASYISDYQKLLKQEIGKEITLQATLDSSIAKGLSMEGLKNIKATMLSMIKGNDSKTNMVISCNDQELTSIEAYTLNDFIYLLIPDLSKAYLKMDINSSQEVISTSQITKSIENFINDPISEDVINKLLKKYAKAAISKIDNVTMKKDVDVTVDGVKSNYTRLTVSINEKNSLNIAKAILDTANKDTDLRDLCIDLGLCTKKSYSAAIKEGLTGISDNLKLLEKKKSNGENILTMYLWVNSKGDITGRSVKIYGDYETMDLGYRTTKSGLKMGVEAWMKSDDQDILRGTGSFTAKLTGVSGDFKISYTDSYADTTSVINVDFKDVKYTRNDTKGFLNGIFTISGKDLNNMSYNINFTGESGKQDILFDILQSDKSIVLINATVKDVPFVDFTIPTSADKYYDMDTQMNVYLENADLKGYLKGIKEKSNLDCIDNYIDGLLTSMEPNTNLVYK